MLNNHGARWLAGGFALVLAGAAVLIIHAVRHAIHVREANETLRPWMSIPYIARSRRVPREVLYGAIGLEPIRRDRRPLSRIAKMQNRTVQELMDRLEAAIQRERPPPPSSHGGPP